MSEVWAAVVGAAAVLLIPLLTWSSQRLTREGRLLLRVNRLGAAYAVMPESPERTAFESHLRRAVEMLNDELDEDKRARRWVQRFIAVVLYALGIIGLVAFYNSFGWEPTTFTWVIGLMIGTAVAVLTQLSAVVIDRFALRRAQRREQDERFERIRESGLLRPDSDRD